MTRRTPTAHEERVLGNRYKLKPGTPVTLYVGAEPEPQEEGDEHGDHGKGKSKGGG